MSALKHSATTSGRDWLQVPTQSIELPALSSRNGAARPVYQARTRIGLLAQGNYGTADTAGDTRDPMCGYS